MSYSLCVGMGKAGRVSTISLSLSLLFFSPSLPFVSVVQQLQSTIKSDKGQKFLKEMNGAKNRGQNSVEEPMTDRKASSN